MKTDDIMLTHNVSCNGSSNEGIVSLRGKKGLIVGIANESSIAYGCARMLRGAGAEIAVTYLNAKAESFVRPLAEKLESPIVIPCDVREPGQRFDELLERTRARTPEHRLVSIEDVGNLAVFLVSDAATGLTGNIEYIDAGYHIVG